MNNTLLYLDPFAGISGDMFVGALLDLGLELDTLKRELGRLHMSGYELSATRVMRGGLSAMKFDVALDTAPEKAPAAQPLADAHAYHAHGLHAHHTHAMPAVRERRRAGAGRRRSMKPAPGGSHAHSHWNEIKALIEGSTLSAVVKANSLKVFGKLAVAEGRIHNVPTEQVAFHEAGALDSIIDIVGACIGLEALQIETLWCGPLALGSGGYIQCAHGTLPVPAPATLELVKGLPLRDAPVAKELTTPTGAALVAALAGGFGPLAALRIERIGYGAGSRVEQAVPNVLRALIGTRQMPAESGDTIVEIQTNLDDCSAEVLGYLSERLLTEGAVDVFFTAIQSKKNRPATLVSVLAPLELRDKLAGVLFQESTTFGLRYQTWPRMTLARRSVTVQTPYGPVRVKVGVWQERVVSVHPEFEDCRGLAQSQGVPLRAVQDAARNAYAGEAG